MHEDRLLELIRHRRDHQRSRLHSLERRGLFVIALVSAVGAGISMLAGGNMSEVWGSMLLAGLFVIVTGLLLTALLFAGATVFPLDGRHLFHSGRSERARGWDRWLTDKGFEGRPLADFRSLLPEEPEPEKVEEELASETASAEDAPESVDEDGAESPVVEPAAAPEPPPPPMTEAEKITHTRQRLSDFLAETVLDGQHLDLSVDPLLRTEVMDYWSTWFIAERSAGLLRRAMTMAMLALALGGLTSIQLSEELASSTQSSQGADGAKGGKSGKSGKGGGGMDSEGGKSSKGGKGGLEGGKSGKSGLEGGGAPEPKGGKAGKSGQGSSSPEGGSGAL